MPTTSSSLLNPSELASLPLLKDNFTLEDDFGGRDMD